MTAVAARGAEARLGSRTFYVWMAVGFIAAAFLGFAPTYWAPLAAGAAATDVPAFVPSASHSRPN